MKAVKGLGVKGVIGTIRRKATAGPSGSGSTGSVSPAGAPGTPQGETPEAIAARSVKQFIEFQAPSPGADDDYLFLPAIVDAAESSPAAAAECARLLRKYLTRDYSTTPSYQYKSVMLMRILTDNPGPRFTRNLDKKFVETVKELLKGGRDASVRQILMETLDAFEAQRVADEGLGGLVDMWRREKEKAQKVYGNRPPVGPRTLNAPVFDPAAAQQAANAAAHQQANYWGRAHSSRHLPNPIELASRLEEARTSAKLLSQVVSCTPTAEVLEHELMREFADRCLSASRSIQAYMVAENPGPDNDTMEALIDVNEQLQRALSMHQRAVLNARKVLGVNPAAPPPGAMVSGGSGGPSPVNGAGGVAPPPAGPPPNWGGSAPVADGSAIRDKESSGGGPLKWLAAKTRAATGSKSSSPAPPPPPSNDNGNNYYSTAAAPQLPYRPAPTNNNSYGSGQTQHSSTSFSPPPGPPPQQSTTYAPPPQPPPKQQAQPAADPSEDPFRDPEPRLGIEPWHPGGFSGAAPNMPGPTPSYVGRQESAVGGVQMHGGASSGQNNGVHDDDIVSPSTPPPPGPLPPARKPVAAGGPPPQPLRQHPVYDPDEEDDEDLYSASPATTTKKPAAANPNTNAPDQIYRY